MVRQYNDFKHLPLTLKIKGRAHLTGGGGISPQTEENKKNYQSHSQYLKSAAMTVSQLWKQKINARDQEGVPKIPKAVPILLEIDPEVDADFLRTFGFEIVSEQDDGFVVVATEDIDFKKFLANVEKFAQQNPKSGSSAKIHKLYGDDNIDLRLKRILSESLYEMWPNIDEHKIYYVDVGIECLGTYVLPDPVERKENETDEQFQARLKKWQSKVSSVYEQWDRLRIERESALYDFVSFYSGEIISLFEDEELSFTKLSDSFTARIKIVGKGLRDLAINFPYIFEITEPEEYFLENRNVEIKQEEEFEIELIPPDENAPRVCVIDSGIQEGHFLLRPCIDTSMSFCYLPGETDVSDYVKDGGHGTRVAGAVLYPREIPRRGIIEIPFWIQNARVLDDNNGMPKELFPPRLIRAIVERYHLTTNTRIFNHSIAGHNPCRLQHMSSWAAEIDNLSYEYDVLFIQAAGNIKADDFGPFRLGIRQHYAAGRKYPDYLLEKSSRIPNPAQSLQCITVGSICHGEFEDAARQSLGKFGWPSAFSASGPGIWDVIKPDVVEYGGSFVVDSGNPPNITYPPEVCPELLRATPPAVARDDVGTSYAAPKVAHIAAHIQRLLPNEPTLLYRALIVQSARWPDWVNQFPEDERHKILRFMGYGLPDLERATTNNPYRVTLITTGRAEIFAREAHIYEVPIPDNIRSIGSDYDILIEITLSYVAKPRRTRKKLRGYLSTWLDWKTSNIGESPRSFANRVLHDRDHSDRDDESGIPWIIGARKNTGKLKEVSRNAGTLQKDWAIIKSHQLTEGFCIAVVGHKGWNKDPNIKAYYSLVVSFEAVNREIEIYDPIRARIEAEVETETEVEVEMNFENTI